jgi:hypothetical protein
VSHCFVVPGHIGGIWGNQWTVVARRSERDADASLLLETRISDPAKVSGFRGAPLQLQHSGLHFLDKKRVTRACHITHTHTRNKAVSGVVCRLNVQGREGEYQGRYRTNTVGQYLGIEIQRSESRILLLRSLRNRHSYLRKEEFQGCMPEVECRGFTTKMCSNLLLDCKSHLPCFSSCSCCVKRRFSSLCMYFTSYAVGGYRIIHYP